MLLNTSYHFAGHPHRLHDRALLFGSGAIYMMDMSHASVVADLARRAPDLEILVSAASTATVDEAAATLGVEPGRIAKTIAIRVAGAVLLLVTRGDARIDNAKCKAAFGGRPRMLGADEVLALTGHPVGGVCPFGLATPLPVWLDRSLLAFDAVYPAAGSLTSSVRITPHRLAEVTAGRWTDACCLPAPSQLD